VKSRSILTKEQYFSSEL